MIFCRQVGSPPVVLAATEGGSAAAQRTPPHKQKKDQSASRMRVLVGVVCAELEPGALV